VDISKYIPGVTFHEILRNDPEKLSKLDPKKTFQP